MYSRSTPRVTLQATSVNPARAWRNGRRKLQLEARRRFDADGTEIAPAELRGAQAADMADAIRRASRSLKSNNQSFGAVRLGSGRWRVIWTLLVDALNILLLNLYPDAAPVNNEM